MSRSRTCERRGTYLPLAPLAEALCWSEGAARVGRRDDWCFSPPTLTLEEVAAKVGVTRRTWIRWSNAGRLPWDAADAAATACGFHPLTLWPDFHSIAEVA